MKEVVIVGGGVIGMLTARELLHSGVAVTLIERNELGREASWAGGGIISPLYPWTYSDAITALAGWAQETYPLLVDELYDETDIDPEINPCGLIVLDPPTQAAAKSWALRNHKLMSEWSADQVVNHEPHLAKSFTNALWLPDVSSIRNPRLLKALKASLAKNRNFTLWENYEVCEIEQKEDGGIRIHGRNQNSYRDAETVIVCSGAWSKQLLQPLGVEVPIEPVRGQMMVFKARPGMINSVILKDGKYLIPRKDGRILIGSTMEYAGFEKLTTNEAREELLQKACELVPELATVEIEAHWCGLRPGSPEGIPYIGKVPGPGNLYINAGHFRNGLVLAPASARLMRDMVLGLPTDIDPAPFAISAPRLPDLA